ncbi:MAG: hypothetical protein GYA47_03580 [Desulfovibrio sp.]|nr:hypothetical protein [Desulfovibrio sp.]
MRITCPECGFTRNVPDDKVPATSAMATCPKCRHRFRFRELDDGGERGAWVGEPPIPEPRLPGEGVDAPPAGSVPDASGPVSDTVRRHRTAEQASHWPDPDAAFVHKTASAPKTAPSSPGSRRGFPPPSAHWEPAATEDAPGSEPTGASAPDAPSDSAHVPDRLSVDVRDVASARSEHGVGKEPGAEQNGVRDIWARLQAMDDEDASRHVPSRAARPAMSRQDVPGEADVVEEPFQAVDSPGSEASREQGGPPGARPGDDGRAGLDSPTGRTSGRERPPLPDADSPDGPKKPEGEQAFTQPGLGQGEVPWERLDVYGFFPGLVLTLKRILFQPVDFFETMPSGRGKGKAMVFNLLLSEFLLVIDFLWALFGVRAKIADTGQTDALAAMAGVPGLGFLVLLIMVPLFMVAGIYLDAGLTHLLLMLLRGSGKGFDETFRVMFYSSAPTVLSAVPVSGQLLLPVILIWYMTLQAIGLKKVHGAAYSQTLAVVLIKWSMYLFLLLGVLHGLANGV